MVNFNSLSEGEKFAFSKQFLIQYQTIKKLQPTLTQEKDLIYLVVDKCYEGNLTVVEDCIRFMYSKKEFSSLDEVRLDDPINEYVANLRAKVKEKQDEADNKNKILEKKKKDYDKATAERNEIIDKFQEAQEWKKTKSIIKWIFIVLAVSAGLSLLATYGGIVGIINQIPALLMELNFTQTLTLGLIGYWGFYKGVIKEVWGKVKEKFKGRADNKKKNYNKLKEAKESKDQEREKLASEVANLEVENANAKNALDAQKAIADSEISKLDQYKRFANFEKILKSHEVLIKTYYSATKRRATTEDEANKLEDWYNHYIGAMYYGAMLGDIQTQDDFNSIVEQSKNKFNQVLDPLYVDTEYTEANIKNSMDPRTAVPLDEMFTSI